jgi:hypothetical protein
MTNRKEGQKEEKENTKKDIVNIVKQKLTSSIIKM